MFDRRVRSIAAATAISAVAAVAAAGCGSSSTKTVTSTTAASSGGSTTGGGSGGTPAGGGGGGSNPLAAITPPPGSTKIDSRSSGGAFYARYSTNQSPAQVTSAYKSELSGMGWSIVNSGGAGGGWGPYGGSGSGLTAKKREDEYVDVQAGGARGQKTYFEVCASSGKGSRSACDSLSDQSNHKTHSGGSPSGSSSTTTSSGGS